jgi:P27 family predicted phage terminase small subunit
MGRRRQPAEVQEAKGNPGRRPIAKGAAKEDGTVAQPAVSTGGLPEWIDTRHRIPRGRKGWGNAARLSGLAERIWNFAHPELVRLNLVKSLDEIALGIYCRAVAEYVDCTDTIDREGAWYSATSYASTANEGPAQILKRPHPAVRQRKEAYQVIKEQGEVLGMNPSARQRMFQMLLGNVGQGRLPGMDEKPSSADEPGLPMEPKPSSPVGLLN